MYATLILMNPNSATEAFVRDTLGKEGTGHDWWHCVRVRNTAVQLAKEERADALVVELAALLHDIADHKFHNGDTEMGPRTAREFLEGQGVQTEVIEHAVNIVRHMSWSKSKDGNNAFDSVEMRVVQDADRLDALGAIGIARCFAYGGYAGRLLYDPEGEAGEDTSAIQHFHDKLLKIKDTLHTRSARKLAQERHRFMETYLKRFHGEWDGRI